MQASSEDIKANSVNRIIAQSTSSDITIEIVDGYSKIKSTYGSIEIEKYNITKNSKIETTSSKV